MAHAVRCCACKQRLHTGLWFGVHAELVPSFALTMSLRHHLQQCLSQQQPAALGAQRELPSPAGLLLRLLRGARDRLLQSLGLQSCHKTATQHVGLPVNALCAALRKASTHSFARALTRDLGCCLNPKPYTLNLTSTLGCSAGSTSP